jgi:hypothetical protein
MFDADARCGESACAPAARHLCGGDAIIKSGGEYKERARSSFQLMLRNVSWHNPQGVFPPAAAPRRFSGTTDVTSKTSKNGIFGVVSLPAHSRKKTRHVFAAMGTADGWSRH